MKEIFALGIVAGMGITFCIAIIVVTKIIDKVGDEWKLDAVKHGAAEFVMDPATGTTKWQWKKAAEYIMEKP